MADSPQPERSRRIRPRPVARAASTTGLADAGFIVPPVDEKPHYLGHRQRLRERLLNAGAAALLGVTLHDHIIIGRGRHASLKSLGLF